MAAVDVLSALGALRTASAELAALRRADLGATELPAFDEARVELYVARAAAVAGAVAAGARFERIRFALGVPTASKAQRIIDAGADTASARRQALADWGQTLGAQARAAGIDHTRLAVLAEVAPDDILAMERGDREPTDDEVARLRGAMSLEATARTARILQLRGRPRPVSEAPLASPDVTPAQRASIERIRAINDDVDRMLLERRALIADLNDAGLGIGAISRATGLAEETTRKWAQRGRAERSDASSSHRRSG